MAARSANGEGSDRQPARLARIIGLTLVALALSLTAAHAQSNPRYIQFSPNATKGALYLPDGGAAPHVAFLVIHRTSNFLSHPAALELPKRGFMVLAMNPRSDNNEAAVHWEDNALDIRQGVEFLRKQPGITKVLLIGHSGGGPATSYYQAVAETGPSYCRGPGKLVECGDAVAGLPPADGIVFLDAHPGNSVNGLRSLNPAVTDEAHPFDVDPALDPFDAKNGFNQEGDSHYSEEFQRKFYRAQAERMNRLIDRALKIRDEMKAGTHRPTDDDVFIAYRDRARLSDISTGASCCTTRPQKLIRNDGSIDAHAIVRTVRVSTPVNAKLDASYSNAMQLTIRSFLSANAIRAKDSLEEIDWCSSNNSTPCAVRSISVPVLVMAMQGHYFMRDGEVIFDNAASKDKDFALVEGAIHNLAPCPACSKVTGLDYGNARKNLFDYVAKWTSARF
jgi:pimeloyl-ACP methyl ester carboxylesterase